MTIEWQRISRPRYRGSQKAIELVWGGPRRRAAIRADPGRL